MPIHSAPRSLAALAAGTLLSLASAAETQPNVVFIVADDLATRLQPYGDTIACTPRLNELASEGVTFDCAFGQGGVCTPSRRSFLSGLSTKTVKADGGSNYFNQNRNTMTVGRLFRQQGYQTIAIGKVEHEDGLKVVDDNGNNQGEPPRNFWLDFFRSGANTIPAGATLTATVNGVTVGDGWPAGTTLDKVLADVNAVQGQYRIAPQALGGPGIEALGASAGKGFAFRLAQPGQVAWNLVYDEVSDHQDRKAWDIHPMKPTGANGKTLAVIPHPTMPSATMHIYTYDDSKGVLEDGRRAEQFSGFLNSRSATAKPFFAAVGFHNPHGPLEAHQRLHDKYFNLPGLPFETALADATPVSRFAFTFTDWHLGADQARRYTSAYYAAIEELDAHVGRVIDDLKAKGIYDDTIVVFTSDQGYHLGFHGQWNKHSVYPEVPRVPLIVRYPKKVAKGKVATGTVELVDVFPTLVDLARPTAADGGTVGITDIESAPGRSNGGTDLVIRGETIRLDGRSFARQLAEPGVAPGKPAGFIEWQTETNGKVFSKAVYTRTHCYIEHYGTAERELYNRIADPKGYVNLLAAATPTVADREEAARLADLLHAYFPKPVNQAPIAIATRATTTAGVEVELTLTGRDDDGAIKEFLSTDGNLKVDVDAGVSYAGGIFSQKARYRPASGFTGTVTCTVTAVDHLDAKSAPATVTITVTDATPNAAPVALAQATATVEGTALAIVLAGSDQDGIVTGYTATQPAHGTLGGSGAKRVYTPAAGYVGTDAFTFTVSDDRGAISAPATVSITVTAKSNDRSQLIYGSGPLSEGLQAPWVRTGTALAVVTDGNREQVHGGASALKAVVSAGGEFGFGYGSDVTRGFTIAPFKAVRFWLNGGSAGGQSIALAVNRLSGLKPRYLLPGPLKAGIWTQHTVLLRDLGAPADTTDLRAFRFYDTTGSARAFYIDDVELLSNRTPLAPTVPAQTAMVGEGFTLTVPAFSDADGDALTYAVSGLPAGLSWNAATRTISGMPTVAGSAVATVTATDGDGASASTAIPVTVLGSGLVIYGSLGSSEGFRSPWLVTSTIAAGSTSTAISATSTELPHGGATAIKALLGPTNECGIASSGVATLGFSTAPYAAVSLWINGGAVGGQKVAMAVNRLLPAGLQAKKVVSESLPANTWRRVIVRLSDLGAENVTDFRAFRFYNQTVGGTPQAFFLDDVVLLDAAQADFLQTLLTGGNG